MHELQTFKNYGHSPLLHVLACQRQSPGFCTSNLKVFKIRRSYSTVTHAIQPVTHNVNIESVN